MEYMFRDLTADDIELRVGVAKENGCSLLLYKNARTDMRILDETVGAWRWRCNYSNIGGVLFCTLELFDTEKEEWVAKQSNGVPSNTEAEKGEASDALKRAGFLWGIGRELYTAPFVWVPSNRCEMEKRQDGKWQTRNRFSVSRIEIDDKRITALEIVNDSTGKTCFKYGAPQAAQEAQETPQEPEQEPERDRVTAEQLEALDSALTALAEHYLEERRPFMLSRWKDAKGNKLAAYPTREQAAELLQRTLAEAEEQGVRIPTGGAND